MSREQIIIAVYAIIMAIMAMILTPIPAEASNNGGEVVVFIKNDKAIEVNANQSLEALFKLNAHHCSVSILSSDPKNIIRSVELLEKSGIKIVEYTILDESNAKTTETRVASYINGSNGVFGIRCSIRNGPAKSWFKANVVEPLVPIAISALTGGLNSNIWGTFVTSTLITNSNLLSSNVLR